MLRPKKFLERRVCVGLMMGEFRQVEDVRFVAEPNWLTESRGT